MSRYRSADQRLLRNTFILHLELLYVVFLQRDVEGVFYSSDGGAVEQLHESPAVSRQAQRVWVEDDVMSHAAVSGGVRSGVPGVRLNGIRQRCPGVPSRSLAASLEGLSISGSEQMLMKSFPRAPRVFST